MEEMRWDLTDVEQPWEEYDAVAAAVDDFEGSLELSPAMAAQDLDAEIARYNTLAEEVHYLLYWPYLRMAKSAEDEEASIIYQGARNLEARLAGFADPLSRWLQGLATPGYEVLDSANAQRLVKGAQRFGEFIEKQRARAKYAIAVEDEKALRGEKVKHAKDLEKRGKVISEFTFSSGRNYAQVRLGMSAPDRRERERTYEDIHEKFGDNQDALFNTYEKAVRLWGKEAAMRRVSPLGLRNYENRVDDEVVDAMLASCGRNVDVFRRFFAWKKRELGLETFSAFDVYAPLETKAPHNMPLEDAVGFVLETFEQFSPELAAHARSVITAKHLDSHPRMGKKGGAFAYVGIPGRIPYVLLNYGEGDASAVRVLAHELGHASHYLYAREQPHLTHFAGSALGETASLVAENLVFERALREASPEQRKALLAASMDDAYGGIGRQAYLAEFERQAHPLIMGRTKPNDVNNLYLGVVRDFFGNDVSVPEHFGKNWLTVDQLAMVPFYVASYSFGGLLGLALTQRCKEEGQSFVPKVEALYRLGGSKAPHEALKTVGVDLKDPTLWDKGFAILRQRQELLEQYE